MWLITKAFYIFIWISVTQEEYLVYETKSTWLGSKSCIFAKPPLTFSEEKITTQLDGLNATKDIWVGYFRINTGFEYIGCVNGTDIADTADQTQASKDPGYCFTICKHKETRTIIGIFNTTCFCLKENDIQNINLTRLHCTKLCTSDTGLACGGVLGSENFVSLYRLNFAVMRDNVDQGRSCLQLEPYNRVFQWTKCFAARSNYPILCAYDQNVFKIQTFKPWINNTVNCFSNNSLPANYTSSMISAVNNGSQLWTGVINSHVIYDFDAQVSSQNDIEYGYLKKSDSAYELKFKEQDKEKSYLCVKGVSTATTPNTRSTSLIAHVTPVVSSTELSKSQTPTSTNYVSGTTIVDYVMEQTQSMKDSSVTVPVVVSVSVLLIAALSIAALVVLRRRGKIPDICGNTNSTESTTAPQTYESSVKKTTEGNQYMEVDDMISNSKTDRNTDVETDNTNYAHTYFVLKKVEKQPEYEDAPGKHAKEMEDSNVYNTLEQELDKKRKQSKTIDNTYDTTKTVAEKLKSKFGEDSDAFDDTDENLYNHTNSVPMKNNNTENVYNVTEDNENAYGDTDTNHENKAHGDDDTYNHI